MSILQAYFQTLGIGDPYVLDVRNATLFDLVFVPPNPSQTYESHVQIYFQTDGSVDYTFENQSNQSNVYDWVSPTGFTPGDYSIRLTNVTETGTGPFTYPSTWTSLSSAVIISASKTSATGQSILDGTVQLSKDGGTTVADSATIRLTAERDAS
jgi:hypothetical protein